MKKLKNYGPCYGRTYGGIHDSLPNEDRTAADRRTGE